MRPLLGDLHEILRVVIHVWLTLRVLHAWAFETPMTDDWIRNTALLTALAI